MHTSYSYWGNAFRLALCLIAAAGSGCGRGERVFTANGKVTYPDGTPLTGAQVEFHSLANPLVIGRGDVDKDGKFRLSTFSSGDGALEGDHEVAVHPPLGMGDRDLTPNPPNVIDEKFEDFARSGLKFTVTEDESKNYFEIVVTKPAKPVKEAPARKVEFGLK